MAAFPIYPNQSRSIREFPHGPVDGFTEGAPLAVDASGIIVSTPALITTIMGFALHDAGRGSPFDTLHFRDGDVISDPNVRGRKQLVAVALARSTFIGSFVDAAGDSVVPLPEHVGDVFNLVEQADETWAVDSTDVTAVVKVERIFPEDNRNQVEFSVLPSIRQIDAEVAP